MFGSEKRACCAKGAPWLMIFGGTAGAPGDCSAYGGQFAGIQRRTAVRHGCGCRIACTDEAIVERDDGAVCGDVRLDVAVVDGKTVGLLLEVKMRDAVVSADDWRSSQARIGEVTAGEAGVRRVPTSPFPAARFSRGA
jgi:hypothetical protein